MALSLIADNLAMLLSTLSTFVLSVVVLFGVILLTRGPRGPRGRRQDDDKHRRMGTDDHND